MKAEDNETRALPALPCDWESAVLSPPTGRVIWESAVLSLPAGTLGIKVMSVSKAEPFGGHWRPSAQGLRFAYEPDAWCISLDRQSAWLYTGQPGKALQSIRPDYPEDPLPQKRPAASGI